MASFLLDKDLDLLDEEMDNVAVDNVVVDIVVDL